MAASASGGISNCFSSFHSILIRGGGQCVRTGRARDGVRFRGCSVRACILPRQFRAPVIFKKQIKKSGPLSFSCNPEQRKYLYSSLLFCAFACVRAGYSSVCVSLTTIRSVSNFSNSSHQNYLRFIDVCKLFIKIILTHTIDKNQSFELWTMAICSYILRL
jgi:hypothetical protein